MQGSILRRKMLNVSSRLLLCLLLMSMCSQSKGIECQYCGKDLMFWVDMSGDVKLEYLWKETPSNHY